MKIILALIFLSVLKSACAQSFNATVFCSTKFAGYFPHPGSANCSSYVKCYLYSGNLLGAEYTCPGTTIFNQTNGRCEVGATCIPPSTTTSTTTTTTTTTTVATTTMTTLLPFNATIFCSTQVQGYYQYPSGCTNYIKCYPYNGNLLGAVYTCIGSTKFDPNLKYCSSGYSC